MENKYPIYIPSKGRANECYTANLLLKYKIDIIIVVEPNDYFNYLQNYNKKILLKLDANNKGLSYVRNFIKLHSIKNKDNYHWQFDDDIKQFQIRKKGKNINVNPLKILLKIEKYLSQYKNIAIAGLRDCVFAWTQKQEISVNKLIASGFIINNNVKNTWSDNMIEDVDYCLQVLLKGYCTIIFNRFLYMKKPNNQADGGQSFIKYEQLNKNLVNKYPNILKLRFDKKRKIYKMAPSRIWEKFTQRLILKNQSTKKLILKNQISYSKLDFMKQN